MKIEARMVVVDSLFYNIDIGIGPNNWVKELWNVLGVVVDLDWSSNSGPFFVEFSVVKATLELQMSVR